MSEEEIELVRPCYGFDWATVGSRREGVEALLEVFSEDFEYHLPSELANRTLHGVQGITIFLSAIEEDFAEFHQDPTEFIDAGPHVVVLGEMRGRGRRSGVPFHSPFGHVWTVRGGRAVRLDGYLQREQALSAAGL